MSDKAILIILEAAATLELLIEAEPHISDFELGISGADCDNVEF
jgi:hypothetical protein